GAAGRGVLRQPQLLDVARAALRLLLQCPVARISLDLPKMAEVLNIESLDLEARGIAHRDGKAIFVEGALPGERVTAETVRRKPSYEIARVQDVLRPSPLRVAPRCPHFGVCGGCAMQHLEPSAQVAIKQRALEDTFWHVGRLRPARMLAPLHGPTWGYRYRARLSVRVVPKKGGVLVGFHERASSYVADMRECHVLPIRVSELLLPLRELVASLGIRRRVPQIEIAVGEALAPPTESGGRAGGAGSAGGAQSAGGAGSAGRADGTRAQADECIALVLRVLDAPDADDLERLRRFAAAHRIEWWLQPKGPD